MRFFIPPKKHGVCPRHQHLARANSGRSSRFAVAQRTFAPFFDASVNTIRPVNGHTPRKLPARASPRSNLSFHRISSPYIITETSSNCNLYFAVISEIFPYISGDVLCTINKNSRIWRVFPRRRRLRGRKSVNVFVVLPIFSRFCIEICINP